MQTVHLKKWCLDFDQLRGQCWTTKGLSALASRLGRPVMMDYVTTKMCNQDIGRLRYARVLIEVEAKKGLPESIDIYCNVFGHKEGKCKLTKEKEGIKERATQGEQERRKFKVVRHGKNNIKDTQQQGNLNNISKLNNNARKETGVMYRVVNRNQNKDNSEKEDKNEDRGRVGSAHNSPRSAWNVNEDILSAIKKTANKFAILQEEVVVECGKWNEEIIKYYKSQRNQIHESNKGEKTNEEEIDLDENDVFIRLGKWSQGQNRWSEKMLKIALMKLKWRIYVVMGYNNLDKEVEESKCNCTKEAGYNHSPAILNCPGVVRKNLKSFRLANYITKKEEFVDTVNTDGRRMLMGMPYQVGVQFAKYFESFLGSKSDAEKMEEKDECLFNKIDDIDVGSMIKEVNDKEIKRALFDIDDSKAHGPDGFTSKTGKLLGEVNATLITLVPKMQTPLKIMVCISTPKFTICVNGESFGYFKGGRGLRQGGLISPYLFTLVMEVLNLILKDEIAKERNFKYHFGCKKLKITHLCFADDLLMLCHGDPTSIKTIKRSLKKFSKISGLHPKMSKSTMFCCSLNEEEKKLFLSILPFQIRRLPVRYLGVPLIDKKIVLSSMQVYWGSVFQLPTTVIKDIETLFKGFLWCNGDPTKGKAKTILSLRNMLMEHIRHKIGNGRNISAWYDRWNDNQTLSNHISKREVCLAGFNDQSKLCDIVYGNRWKWPDDWMVKHNFLLNIHVPTFNDEPDKVSWATNQGKMVKFSTNQVWRDIKGEGEKYSGTS
ncbi:RNA-directed DNA polymerase, eukaryota, reverse transcriptase zinc-binding domain protein [Tanacetum coccineum]